MRCPACKNENPRYPKVPYCDVCGTELSPPARGTTFEPPPPAAAAPPPPMNPHQKRRTVFEPGPLPGGAKAPAAADFFSNPPPPRPPLNPKDPFETSSGAGVEAPRKAKTVVAPGPAGAAPTAVIRGALFEYRGPGDPGRIHAVRAGRNVLGREPTCDIQVEDGRVSSQHAFLFLRADDASYMDVSTNGSSVDGKVINGDQVVIQHGSVIQLGDSTLVLAMLPESAVKRGGG